MDTQGPNNYNNNPYNGNGNGPYNNGNNNGSNNNNNGNGDNHKNDKNGQMIMSFIMVALILLFFVSLFSRKIRQSDYL